MLVHKGKVLSNLYVDDAVIISPKQFVQSLGQGFALTDEGPDNAYLDIWVEAARWPSQVSSEVHD